MPHWQELSQNLDRKFRLVQNSHKLLSKSLGFGKENLHSATGIPLPVHWLVQLMANMQGIHETKLGL